MIKKKAYSIQMSFNTPQSDKKLAEKAGEQFESMLASLKLAVEYLEHIYYPFKKYDNFDPSIISQYRNTFYKYRDEVKNKFDDINQKSRHCIRLMNHFGVDTSVEDVMSSFTSQFKELNSMVALFLSIFDDLNDPELKKNIISTIDSIKKNTNQIKQLINDRILDYLDTNVLAKSWTDTLDENQDETNERTPLVMRLFQERQEALKNNKG